MASGKAFGRRSKRRHTCLNWPLGLQFCTGVQTNQAPSMQENRSCIVSQVTMCKVLHMEGSAWLQRVICWGFTETTEAKGLSSKGLYIRPPYSDDLGQMHGPVR